MNDGVTLEVCVASLEDAIAAEAAGADRLELNSSLELGGLTPGLGLVCEVREAVSIPIVAMVRPRAAGFHYSSGEKRVMLREAELLIDKGVDGLACGALRDDGSLDIAFWSDWANRFGRVELVFHRAFDVVASQEAALQQLIELGATRVLTSGGAETAWSGRQQIARLNRRAADRIEILPGCGVTPDNATALLAATGCSQLHGSFSQQCFDRAGDVCSPHFPGSNPELIARTRSAIDAAS